MIHLVRKPKTGWAAVACVGVLLMFAAGTAISGEDTTPRQLYNDGTKRLREGKLREAETFLQSAVASQDGRVQSVAAYNLGHVRFQQGDQELTNAPASRPVATAATSAIDSGTGAGRALDEALASDDLQTMVSAYLRGRGARKELRAATEAVKRALETYGAVLAKWRRASGDFKSALELRASDADAKTNADIVDRKIAELVDRQQQMAPSQSAMQAQREELGRKLSELRKKLPQAVAEQLKNSGEEDEDGEDGEKLPKEPRAGQEEGPPKTGREMPMTLEEAKRLLGMLKLDESRKLPIGGTDESGKPANRKGRDW